MNDARVRASIGLIGAALLAGIAVALPPLGSAPASATHPCATSSPSASPSPSSTSTTPPGRDYHPACSWEPEATLAADVTVGNDATGTTVHLTVAQRLGVKLSVPSESAMTWADVDADAGGVLYRTRLYVGGSATHAVFTAMATTPGEQVSAHSDQPCQHTDTPCPSAFQQWAVTVVVDPPGATPTPNPNPAPCYTYNSSNAQPGVTVLGEKDNGRTVTVSQGSVISVALGDSCPAGGGFRAPVSSGALYREGAESYQPGAAHGTFRAIGSHATTITAITDAPCLHVRPGCAIAQAGWSVDIQIVRSDCALSGPASVPASTPAVLVGRVAPMGDVLVWFRQRGAAEFVVRRQLRAGNDGMFSTTFLANDDYRWYATAGNCTTEPGLTHVTSWITGPRFATRGSVVPIAVHGPANASVAVYMHPPAGEFRLARSGRLDRSGTFRTSYVARTDERYYAVTGPDGRAGTARVLTQVR
jgi:hypothetical protein